MTTVPILVGDTHREPGEPFEVDDQVAQRLIGLGHAEPAPAGKALETAAQRVSPRKAATLTGRAD